MSKKKPYFPNNWAEFKAAPDDMFVPHTFLEIMKWKVSGWQLPSSVDCIIRYKEPGSERIKERIYQKRKYAEALVEKLVEAGAEEITVCNEHFVQNLLEDDDYDYDYDY